MKIFKAGIKNRLLSSKRTPHVFKPKFLINQSQTTPFLNKTRNYLSNINTRSVSKMFFNIGLIGQVKNNRSVLQNLDYTTTFLTKPDYLLNFRNIFFTKELNLVGSICWSWFFDANESLNIKLGIEVGNENFTDRIQLTPRKFRKNLKLNLNTQNKKILSFFFKKKLLKPRKRNLKRIAKLILSFGIKSTKDLMRSHSGLLKIINSQTRSNLRVRIKQKISSNKRTKHYNPYLYTNNKSLRSRKPQRYSYDAYLFSSLKSQTISHKRYVKQSLFSKTRAKSKSFKKSFFHTEHNKFFHEKITIRLFKTKLLSAKMRISKSQLDKVRMKRFFKKSKILKKKRKPSKRVLFRRIFKKKTRIRNIKRGKVFKKFLNNSKNYFTSLVQLKNNNHFTRKHRNAKLMRSLHSPKIAQQLFSIKTSSKKRARSYLQFHKHSKRINFREIRRFKKRSWKWKIAAFRKLNKSHNYLASNTQSTKLLHNSKRKTPLFNRKPTKLFRKKKKKLMWSSKSRFTNSLLPKLITLGTTLFGSSFIPTFTLKFISKKIKMNIRNLDIAKSFTNYRYVTLKSKKNKPFVFRNVGVFLWSQRKKFFDKNSKTKFIFKKKLYSFLFPNEVRKAIMDRRKAFKSYHFIHKASNLKRRKSYYSLVFFKNTYKDFFKLENLNNSLGTNIDPLKYKSLRNLITREEIIYESEFKNRGHIENSRGREIFLKRIRFKPGYQRIWRQAREAALEHFKIRTVYQQQLTKYLSKFYRQAHFNSFMYLETTLGRTIVYSRLLPDYPTVNLFKDKNFIFLNGRTLPELSTQVVPTDFIQLLISNWFYIYNKYITNTTITRVQKFRRLVYRKGMAHKYKVIKLRKQKSRYTPKWVYYSRFDNSDIKTYFEVDYFTMSMYVIYNPYILDYSAPDDTIDLRISIYKMYNWKYIT